MGLEGNYFSNQIVMKHQLMLNLEIFKKVCFKKDLMILKVVMVKVKMKMINQNILLNN